MIRESLPDEGQCHQMFFYNFKLVQPCKLRGGNDCTDIRLVHIETSIILSLFYCAQRDLDFFQVHVGPDFTSEIVYRYLHFFITPFFTTN